MARLNTKRDGSALLAVVVAVVVIATLYLASEVLIPFALAMLFSFLLTPLVILLERIRLPRVVAVTFVILLFITSVGFVGWTVGNQLVDVTSQFSNYRTNIKNKIESIRDSKNVRLTRATTAVAELSKELSSESSTQPATARSASPARPLSVQVVPSPTNFWDYVPKVLRPLGTAGIAIVFTIFMLMRREDMRNRFIRLAGQGRLTVMTQALDEAARRVSRYVLLQFLVNVCYGLLVSGVLYLIGVPNALLWGVAAGIFRFLPYIGPPMGALFPILLSLAVFDGWTKALITIGFFVALELIVSNLLEPNLYGAHTGISALAILVAAVFWTLLWGPIGLVLSTPLTVCLVVMARHVPHLGFLQVILGDEPVLPPEVQCYQRLLAGDQKEAKDVMEAYLKDKSLEDLYDAVLVPALSLVERDRHKSEIDDATAAFIWQSVKEVVEELDDEVATKSSPEVATDAVPAGPQQGSAPVSADRSRVASLKDRPGVYVMCVPVRDEADEIVSLMLANLLDKAGFRSRVVEIGTIAEMLEQVVREKPDIVCLSALAPFASSHARRLYGALHEKLPELKIVIGLWQYSGDPVRAESRITGGAPGQIYSSLLLAKQQVELLCSIPKPAEVAQV